MQKEIRIPEYIRINNLTFYAVEQDTPSKMCGYLQMLKELQSWDPGIVV